MTPHVTRVNEPELSAPIEDLRRELARNWQVLLCLGLLLSGLGVMALLIPMLVEPTGSIPIAILAAVVAVELLFVGATTIAAGLEGRRNSLRP